VRRGLRESHVNPQEMNAEISCITLDIFQEKTSNGESQYRVSRGKGNLEPGNRKAFFPKTTERASPPRVKILSTAPWKQKSGESRLEIAKLSNSRGTFPRDAEIKKGKGGLRVGGVGRVLEHHRIDERKGKGKIRWGGTSMLNNGARPGYRGKCSTTRW